MDEDSCCGGDESDVWLVSLRAPQPGPGCRMLLLTKRVGAVEITWLLTGAPAIAGHRDKGDPGRPDSGSQLPMSLPLRLTECN